MIYTDRIIVAVYIVKHDSITGGDRVKEEYMLRAIALAKQGIGKVNPNPLVGAVVVKNDEIIAEGYHACYGELHAERHAFSKLQNPEDARGAELYVTLEPCCHHGKQPPCTQAIIEHGIRKVYVGSDDPNELVAGKGIRQLLDAGIEVETQVLKAECDALNPVFFRYISTGLPYVVMKYAMTLDGKIACDSGKSKWVTSETAREHVQETRNALSAIMVGVQTVLQDDPLLTCRLPGGRNPVRIVCDSHLRIPLQSQLVQTVGRAPVWVATLPESLELPQAKKLQEKGVELLPVPGQQNLRESVKLDLEKLMKILGEKKIDGILLEGGGTLHAGALEAGIVNHAQVYIAPKWFGGSGRYTPVHGAGVEEPSLAWQGYHRKITSLGEDILLEYDLR
ncbi:MAG: bifunctional diaminohydroxyphosphoribosylaminopyrimidine deaminase/5-amino-6-(5-phosphoribosylamino)uracil reductase RibD [Lachnospiraceae bacterium]|nr:bifunctional diaminohydroxyphosphoribosylaminopyrimidine deaminase/5-amino-6-(5-phosphoribosylamino)uracil reductase RibD [Lachnospiraceae bacterium]